MDLVERLYIEVITSTDLRLEKRGDDDVHSYLPIKKPMPFSWQANPAIAHVQRADRVIIFTPRPRCVIEYHHDAKANTLSLARMVMNYT